MTKEAFGTTGCIGFSFFVINLNEKLKIAPIGGGFIVTDQDAIEDNYALIYMPEIAYMAKKVIPKKIIGCILRR